MNEGLEHGGLTVARRCLAILADSPKAPDKVKGIKSGQGWRDDLIDSVVLVADATVMDNIVGACNATCQKDARTIHVWTRSSYSRVEP